MQTLIGTLLRELLKRVDAETVKEIVERALDVIETKVEKSATKWDDVTVLPLIATIRSLACIEDKKYGSDKE
jgi:hypothetical protein